MVLEKEDVNIDVDDMISLFKKYMYAGSAKKFSKDDLIQNLEQKKNDIGFRQDIEVLLPFGTPWNFDQAYEEVMNKVFKKVL